jgi:hypothetical protein
LVITLKLFENFREAGGYIGNYAPETCTLTKIDLLDRTIIAIRPGDSLEANQKRLQEIQSLLEPVPYDRDL